MMSQGHNELNSNLHVYVEYLWNYHGLILLLGIYLDSVSMA